MALFAAQSLRSSLNLWRPTWRGQASKVKKATVDTRAFEEVDVAALAGLLRLPLGAELARTPAIWLLI
eukprot:15449102-Alexandrium_andersonii.AAC.1